MLCPTGGRSQEAANRGEGEGSRLAAPGLVTTVASAEPHRMTSGLAQIVQEVEPPHHP